MNGFPYPAPISTSGTYNPAFMLSGSSGLTLATAENLFVATSDSRMSYISGLITGASNVSAANISGSRVLVTGGSAPSSGTAIGMRYDTASSTGIINAYDYTGVAQKAININNGSIYIKADKTIGIGNVTPGYAMDITGFCNASSGLKVGGTTAIDSSRNATLGTVTASNYITASANLDDADFLKLDAITNGTVAAGKAMVVSSNKDIGVARHMTVKNLNVQGDTGTTDDFSNLSRLVNAIDSAMPASSNRYITLGQGFSAYNSGEISFRYESPGSDSNRLSLGGYGFSDALSVFGSGSVSIGTTSKSSARLYLTSGTGNSTIPGSSTVQIFATSGITQSIAPYIVSSPSLKTDGNVIVGGTLYIASDRRLKTDIRSFSNEEGARFVRDIVPKMYRLKGSDRQQFGYIAQDLIAQRFGQLIEMEPDEDMKSDGSPYDLEGYRLTVSYDRVCTLLHGAIKQLMERISALEVTNNQ